MRTTTGRWLIGALLAVPAACGGGDGAAGADARPRDPAEDPSLDLGAYTRAAVTQVRLKGREHTGNWGFGTAEKWDADQDTGVLTWTFADGKKVTADFQIVGTYSTESGTFLWGWDHPSVTDLCGQDAVKVKAFAEEQGWERFLERKIECTEQEAWRIAATAARVCGRDAVYRGPAGDSLVFMTFSGVRPVQSK